MLAVLIFQIAVSISASASTSELPFPDGVKFTVRHKCNVAKYCPDNTCDELVGCGISKARLKKLLYMYLFQLSGYVDLPEWRAKDSTKAAFQSVLKAESSCKSELKEKSRVTCLLKGEQSKKRLKLYMVRFDEGVEARDVEEIK